MAVHFPHAPRKRARCCDFSCSSRARSEFLRLAWRQVGSGDSESHFRGRASGQGREVVDDHGAGRRRCGGYCGQIKHEKYPSRAIGAIPPSPQPRPAPRGLSLVAPTPHRGRDGTPGTRIGPQVPSPEQKHSCERPVGRDKIMVSNRHRPAVKASERSHSRYRHAPASAMLGWRQGLLGDTIFLAQRPHIAAQRRFGEPCLSARNMIEDSVSPTASPYPVPA